MVMMSGITSVGRGYDNTEQIRFGAKKKKPAKSRRKNTPAKRKAPTTASPPTAGTQAGLPIVQVQQVQAGPQAVALRYELPTLKGPLVIQQMAPGYWRYELNGDPNQGGMDMSQTGGTTPEGLYPAHTSVLDAFKAIADGKLTVQSTQETPRAALTSKNKPFGYTETTLRGLLPSTETDAQIAHMERLSQLRATANAAYARTERGKLHAQVNAMEGATSTQRLLGTLPAPQAEQLADAQAKLKAMPMPDLPEVRAYRTAKADTDNAIKQLTGIVGSGAVLDMTFVSHEMGTGKKLKKPAFQTLRLFGTNPKFEPSLAAQSSGPVMLDTDETKPYHLLGIPSMSGDLLHQLITRTPQPELPVDGIIQHADSLPYPLAPIRSEIVTILSSSPLFRSTRIAATPRSLEDAHRTPTRESDTSPPLKLI
jgi:hypothetical protein